MLKHEWIYKSILQQIQAGALQAGAKLPSIRALSEQYGCSKSTIITALERLEEQHLLYAVSKSGYYVVEHQMPRTTSGADTIDFATSSPALHAFPYKDFQHCLNKAIDTYQEDLFRYGTPKGLPSLVAEAQKLLEAYQVFAHKDQIFVTSGVQQALALLSLMPFPNNRSTILVEQPGYHLYLDMLQTYRLPAAGIERTAKGIDLDRLEQMFREDDIKFFYTMPRFHNPLGTSYSRKEKEAILYLAQLYDVYLIEDDNLADFESNPKNDPLFSGDMHDRVIYLKSFSKIMFPGLRIGLAVLPKALIAKFQPFKTTMDVDSSMISQAALDLYLKSGMFDRHRARVRDTYHARAQILQQSIQAHLNKYESSSELVMHSHIVLPKQVNMNALLQHLRERRVEIDSVEKNYLDSFYQERIVKLNVSNVDESRIDEGIKEIAATLNNLKTIFYL